MTKTIKKAEFVNQVAEKVKDNTKIENIVGEVFATIMENVAQGNEVAITGFGKFKAVEVTERKGRNPRTGEEIIISAHKKVTFTVGKIFKGEVNKNVL